MRARASSRTAPLRSRPRWAQAMPSRSICNAPPDDMPVVFHDATLDRLTDEDRTGRRPQRSELIAHSIARQQGLHPVASAPCLRSSTAMCRSCSRVKSTWRRDGKFEANIAKHARVLSRTRCGDVVRSHIASRRFGMLLPSLPRGLIAERSMTSSIGPAHGLAALRHAPSAHRRHRPAQLHRLRYRGAAGAGAAHRALLFGLPLLTWTVRTAEERERALRYADAMIFEGIETLAMGDTETALDLCEQRRPRASRSCGAWSLASPTWPPPTGTPAPDTANPFISHAFLMALEESGSASPETGWLPQHLLLEDGNGALARLHALLSQVPQPRRIRLRSWLGRRLSARRRPLLSETSSSVPFTPVTGQRLLVARRRRTAIAEALLLQAAVQVTEQLGVSSLHITFLTREEWQPRRRARLPQAHRPAIPLAE